MKYVGKKTIASMTKGSTKNVFAVFDPDKCGTSLFGDCLDETDEGVRLDHLMHSGWTPDYCYIEPNIEA